MQGRAEAKIGCVVRHRQRGGATDVAAGGQRGPLSGGSNGRVAGTPLRARDLLGLRDALEVGANRSRCARELVRDVDVLAGSALGSDQPGDLFCGGTPVVTGVGAVALLSSCTSRYTT